MPVPVGELDITSYRDDRMKVESMETMMKGKRSEFKIKPSFFLMMSCLRDEL
ncbi:hypothetical protein P7H12_22170 [Paenibacillus larvae]|nr:hypothetical protein [Paenibacillus larvae]MDT2265752.1 hypothetical protein [Paenibacillus larvae]